MRVGKRFSSACNQIIINSCVIEWATEIRYVGVYLRSGRTLKFNQDESKKKFYRCSNSILSKTGNKPDVVLSLCQCYCIPVLLYGVEAMCLTKTEKQRLASPFTKLFIKLFYVTDSYNIALCQYYMSYLPLHYVIDKRTLKFLLTCNTINNVVLNILLSCT